MKKLISAFVLIFALLFCATPFCAYADTLDTSVKGSITVSLITPVSKDPISNASLSFYRVADVFEVNGELKYALTPSYVSSGVEIKSDSSGNFYQETASSLATFAAQTGKSGVNAKTDANGKAYVGSLRSGLYLVVITKILNAKELPDPFLVSVPTLSDGYYEYDITSKPKLPFDIGGGNSSSIFNDDNTDKPTKPTTDSTIDISDSTSNPTNNDDPSGNTTKPNGTTDINGSTNNTTNGNNGTTGNNGYNPSNPNGTNNNGNNGNNGNNYSGGSSSGKQPPKKLPNTGMLMWPIPVCSVAGPLLFAFGYLDVLNRKRKDEEN